LQQAVLTPFAGDVLHLSVRGSSSFSAMLTIGTIAGMIVAGRPFAEQFGHRRVAFVGLAGSTAAFAMLAAAAAASAAPPAWLATLFLGLASGVFNVSSLALMFTMADRRRAALFMGAWTLAHALADGSATAGGGGVYEIARRVFHSVPGGYGGVFAIEAIGMLLCIPLLKLVDPAKFAAEAGAVHGDASAMPIVEAALIEAGETGLVLASDAAAVERQPTTAAPKRPRPRAATGRAKTTSAATARKRTAKPRGSSATPKKTARAKAPKHDTT
jgi:MFS family permease